MKRSIFSLVGLICLLTLTGTSTAQHTGDVILGVEGDQVVTGRADSSGAITWPNFIWTQNLGLQFPNFSQDPGFDSLSGTFAQGTEVGISMRKALRVWNEDEQHFDDIADPETFTISRGQTSIQSPASDPTGPGEMPSLLLALAGVNGSIHVHPWYELTAPHSAGVYLLELEVWTDTPGIVNSDPFWIVFNQNQSQAVVDAAVAWIEDNFLAPACPADLTGSGDVGLGDLIELINNWGPCSDPNNCPADLTGNGEVGLADLIELINNWGTCQ